VLANRDFLTFQTQLESIHDGIHIWVGGTMESIPTAAYDPIFWAHHSMIDRVWYLWQLEHPGAGVPAHLLDRALAPFPMTVRDTLDVTHLGYDYAASTAAAQGPGHHG
jgi:tyrosinase